jgi:hydrogenase maturation factor
MIPGEVAFPDRNLTVNLVMLPEASVGDHVIVHSGYAIRVVSAETAETATAFLCPDASESATEPTAE